MGWYMENLRQGSLVLDVTAHIYMRAKGPYRSMFRAICLKQRSVLILLDGNSKLSYHVICFDTVSTSTRLSQKSSKQMFAQWHADDVTPSAQFVQRDQFINPVLCTSALRFLRKT